MENTEKSYHHGNLKAELLQTAVEIGRLEGPEAVTIREATRQVGVSPTAAYRHYSDQSTLLNEVSVEAVKELVRRLDKALSDENQHNPTEKMIDCAWAYFDFAMEEPYFFRCMLAGDELKLPIAIGGESDEDGMEHHASVMAKFSQCFEHHAKATDDESHLMHFFTNAVAAWATIHGITVLCTIGQFSGLSRKEKRELAGPVFASAVRGTDFKDPNDLYRNYPDGKPFEA